MIVVTESKLQEKVIKIFKRCGIFCDTVGSRGRRGFPDLVAVYDSRVVFIELKSPKGTGRVAPIQAHTHEIMRAHGATIYVIDSITDAEQVARELTDA